MLADWLRGDAVGATEAGDTGDEEAVVERRGGAVADGDAFKCSIIYEYDP